MSNTVITKKALASSFKELMETQSFEKITVGDICDNCSLNRKTFYYHFPNKYELMNWIFISEYTNQIQRNKVENIREFILVSCKYFYNNRQFYSNALKFDGQNSLFDFLSENLKPLILEYIKESFQDRIHKEFLADIITDAIILSIKKWLCGEIEEMDDVEFTKFSNATLNDLNIT